MSDIFDSKVLSPMLIGEEREAFDSPDYTYELKLDGVRCLAYLGDGKAELINKRKLRVSPIYPELNGIYRQAKGRCILDGELTVLKDGKPEFFEVQRRALMSDPFKIKLAAAQLPVNFTAFDILYSEGEELTKHPLEERQERLRKSVNESELLAVTRVIEGHGIALFGLTAQQGLEGIVAKHKGSLYFSGKRTKDWIKCKNLMDEDFVVCGYIEKTGGVTSIVLGQYRSGALVYKGHVTLGVAGESFRRILSLSTMEEPPYPIPAGNQAAVWVEPRLVCTVKFMEKTAGGGMRQPIFKGLRDDKAPIDCTEK